MTKGGAMPNIDLGDLPSGGLDGDEVLSEIRAFETALRDEAGQAGAPGHPDQLARDRADIERAAEALCRAQPALETWNSRRTDDRPMGAMRQPRPVWLLIGLLWLSTALVTAGAVAAIARLAG
jgi:hypothetical protein